MRPGFFLDNYNDFIGSVTVAVMTHGLKEDSKLGVIVSLSCICLYPALNTTKDPKDIGHVAAAVFKVKYFRREKH